MGHYQTSNRFCARTPPGTQQRSRGGFRHGFNAGHPPWTLVPERCTANSLPRVQSAGQDGQEVDQTGRALLTGGSALQSTAGATAIAILLACSTLAAEERVPMPLGALVCKAIEPAIEHARLVRQPTTAGLRDFVEGQVESGACRVIKSEVTVGVVNVDKRGFALVEEDGQNGQWWTDAENLWGYFDTPAKVKAWKKR